MTYCIVWCIGLGAKGEDYPYLTTKEFLFTHEVRRLDDNLCSFYFCGIYRVAHLESCFSHVKDWFKSFYFVSGHGWKFFACEAARQEFLVHVVCGLFCMIRRFI